MVPVRFWIAGSKETHLAHTLDLTEDGAMLSGFRGELKVETGSPFRTARTGPTFKSSGSNSGTVPREINRSPVPGIREADLGPGRSR